MLVKPRLVRVAVDDLRALVVAERSISRASLFSSPGLTTSARLGGLEALTRWRMGWPAVRLPVALLTPAMFSASLAQPE